MTITDLKSTIARLRRVGNRYEADESLWQIYDLTVSEVLQAQSRYELDLEAWADATFGQTPIDEAFIRELTAAEVLEYDEDCDQWYGRADGGGVDVEFAAGYWYCDNRKVTTRGQLIQLLCSLNVI